MKQRIIKKWEKRGILEEMMRKHSASKGKIISNNNSTKVPKWIPNYSGEQLVRDRYLELQSVDPTNSLLKYGVLDDSNHFEIKPNFYQEQFPGENNIRIQTAVIRYLNMLRKEYDTKCEHSSSKIEQPQSSSLVSLL